MSGAKQAGRQGMPMWNGRLCVPANSGRNRLSINPAAGAQEARFEVGLPFCRLQALYA